MSEQFTPPSDITSDDKLWAALSYVFAPIIPIVLLLWEEKKNRPFIKAHSYQSLIIGIIMAILVPVIATFTFGCGSLLWILMLYWGYKAYQGEYINIPVITDFCKKQGWA